MNQSVRRLIIAMLLGVVVYGAFVAVSGYRSVETALQNYRWQTFALALSLTSVNYLLRYFKWEFYLRRLGVTRIPPLSSLLIFLSGFVLTVTPGKVGEVFKSAVLHQTHGVDPARTAPIIVAERLTDVIGIIALIVIGSAGFSGGMLWASLGTAAVLLGLALILWRRPLEVCIAWVETRFSWGKPLAPRLRTAHESLKIVASPGALLVPTVLSVVGWGLEGVGLWLILGGFDSAAPLPLAVFIYATATLAGALVPLPGGLGVAEAMFQSQLVQLAGVAVGAATASMLLIRFATLWWAVIVGFVALGILRGMYRDLLRSSGS